MGEKRKSDGTFWFLLMFAGLAVYLYSLAGK